MLSRCRPIALAVLGAVSLVASPAPAEAAETASSELVIITEGDVTEGDLYATGVRVLIEGTVDGDLIAFAAEDITVTGQVTGSILGVAPVVQIDGQVGDSVRVSANELGVTGAIEGDLVGAVVSADLAPTSSVGGDALLWAWEVTAAGTIGGDLKGTQRRLDLEGTVTGDVDVTVRHLAVSGPLSVGGDFGYRSPTEAEGMDQLTLGGVVVHKFPTPPNVRVRALGLVARVLAILALVATALLIAWGWPTRTRRAGDIVRSQPVKSWGNGALVMLSPLLLGGLAALVAGLTPASASLPLLVIFVPLVLISAGIVLVLSLVAGIPAALALGEALPGEFGMFGSLLLGAAVVGLLWLVPIVGWLVVVLALPLGLGAWMLSFRGAQAPAEG